jgi:hypothetical protein
VRRTCIVLCGLVLLWSVPTGISAQVLAGSGDTWGTSVLKTCCGTALQDPPCLYVGWLEHSTGSTCALKRTDSTGTAPWPLRGIWLGASKDLCIDEDYGLLVSGGVFLPRHSSGAWYTAGRNPVPFEIPSYDWWSVDGLAKRRVSGPFEVLAGFRWDHTSTRVNYSDISYDDYILNAYLPVIGAQVNQRFSTGSLVVRFIGTPVVWGRLKYAFWAPSPLYEEEGDFPVIGGSSFMEFFAEYGAKIRGDLSLGGFVRWNALNVKTSDRPLSGFTNEPVSWNVDIRSWTIGANLCLEFSGLL